MFDKNKAFLQNTTVFLIILIVLCFMVISNNVQAEETNNDGKKHVLVALGDSYSSGEGIEPFIGQDQSNKTENKNWLAHRSTKAWSGKLTIPSVSGTLSDHWNENWFFVAASGAESKHLTNNQIVTYNYDSIFNYKEAKLAPQLDVFSTIGNAEVDYVTLTIGGNDVGFSDVIISGITSSMPFLNPNGLSDKMKDTWVKFEENGVKENLLQAYRDIHDKVNDDTLIIVAGYPKLLSEKNTEIIDKKQAAIINRNVSKFNSELKNLVTEAQNEGINITFVSVEEEFDGHEAYSSDEYINKIKVIPQNEDVNRFSPSAYSIHPNEKGAVAYAKCVQQAINYNEQKKNQSKENSDYHDTNTSEKDIVLLIDNSGSMSGDAIELTKSAALQFVDHVLSDNVNIGLVTYESSSSVRSTLTSDKNRLESAINSISSSGGTNMEGGLKTAEQLLSTSNAKSKFLVLMSDGLPNEGKVKSDLINYASTIKNNNITLYTLGYFGSNSGGTKSEAQWLMENLASSGCHYEVSNSMDLSNFFADIALQINGQKLMYLKIACPVDVKVEKNGEKLDSSFNDQYRRTSFGVLSYMAESEDVTSNDSSEQIKILRLIDDGSEYDIDIVGTGEGSMNYSISFMNEDGDYTDERNFENIAVNEKTEIATVARNSGKTMLSVDDDGDGIYDTRYIANENETGKVVNYLWTDYASMLVAIISIIIIIIITYYDLKKRN